MDHWPSSRIVATVKEITVPKGDRFTSIALTNPRYLCGQNFTKLTTKDFEKPIGFVLEAIVHLLYIRASNQK